MAKKSERTEHEQNLPKFIMTLHQSEFHEHKCELNGTKCEAADNLRANLYEYEIFMHIKGKCFNWALLFVRSGSRNSCYLFDNLWFTGITRLVRERSEELVFALRFNSWTCWSTFFSSDPGSRFELAFALKFGSWDCHSTEALVQDTNLFFL